MFYYFLFPSEAIHQRILLYNKLVIAQAITKLLYSKVLTSYCTVRCLSQCKINSKSAVTYLTRLAQSFTQLY